MNKIAILMATYNGSNFIKEQIESIFNQSFLSFDLYIHDDNSTDNTISIIKEFQKKYNNIYFVDDNVSFHSANYNFFYLLNYIKNMNYEYVAFCDQDDIWEYNKLDLLYNKISKMDSKKPCLVHSDAMIINKYGDVVSNSYNMYSNSRKQRTDIFSISLWNNAQGAASIINKKCLEYIDYDIKKIYMYDWWFSIISSYYGYQCYIPNPLLKYRQHEKNVIGGSKSKSFVSMMKKGNFKKYKLNNKKNFDGAVNNMIGLLEKDKCNLVFKNIIESIRGGFFKKVKFIFTNKLIKKKGFKSCLGLLLYKYK